MIAGVSADAWAVGTTSTGSIKWRYDEPAPSARQLSYQVDVQCRVPLANGDALLCGQHITPEHQAGIALITILDANGQLVERRDVLPPMAMRAFLPRRSIPAFGGAMPWPSLAEAQTAAVHTIGSEARQNGAYEWVA